MLKSRMEWMNDWYNQWHMYKSQNHSEENTLQQKNTCCTCSIYRNSKIGKTNLWQEQNQNCGCSWGRWGQGLIGKEHELIFLMTVLYILTWVWVMWWTHLSKCIKGYTIFVHHTACKFYLIKELKKYRSIDNIMSAQCLRMPTAYYEMQLKTRWISRRYVIKW